RSGSQWTATVVTAVRIAQMLATFMNAGDTRSGKKSEVVPETITQLFRRSLPCGCARRALLVERTLSHPRFCPFYRQPRLRSRLFLPCRPPSPLPLSLLAENLQCIRCRDKSRCALFVVQTL